MTWAGRMKSILFACAIALIAAGCSTSTSVNTSKDPSTPIPTQTAVVIPTTAPRPTAVPTPTVAVADGTDTASDTESATPDATPTTVQTPTVEPTPTALVLPIPTGIAQPTRVQQPARPPAPRPAAVPTRVVVSGCANGGFQINGICSCPGGQANRPGDGKCVRLCNQADLTIANTCVCTGELFDDGGQCVKRCIGGQIADGYGGCKRRGD